MCRGIVKKFNYTKGAGTIVQTTAEWVEVGPEIFVHISGLMDDVKENDRVYFDEQVGKKGLNAVNVRLANTPG